MNLRPSGYEGEFLDGKALKSLTFVSSCAMGVPDRELPVRTRERWRLCRLVRTGLISPSLDLCIFHRPPKSPDCGFRVGFHHHLRDVDEVHRINC